MSDIVVRNDQSLPGSMRFRYVEQVDGSYAPVREIRANAPLPVETRLPNAVYIYNIDIVFADLEYTLQLMEVAQRIHIRSRNGNAFRLAFEPGYVVAPNPPYLSIPANGAYEVDGINYGDGNAIYIAGFPGDVIEVEVWARW